MKFETSVKEIVVRTDNVKSFRFPRPVAFDYKAGQWMFVTIRYGGEELRKHFTISSSPTEENYLEFTKKLTGSGFSNALSHLKAGDWARINGPFGRFTFEGEHNKVGMLSGGIGITPLRSMCRYCIDKGLNTKVILLYGARTERDLVFKKELTEMQEQNRNLKVVFTVEESSEGWKGYTGYIDREMILEEITDYEERVFFTCGPQAMVKAIENLLNNLQVSKKQVKKEIFTGY
jgi:ferredoxin-NADP reductase